MDVSGAELIGVLAAVLGTLALLDGLAEIGGRNGGLGSLLGPRSRAQIARVWDAAQRLGLERRLANAGCAERISVPVLLACKAASAALGVLAALIVMPAAPTRLGWLVALGMPVAGFLAPDAILEREARRRLGRLRMALPDALDLVAVGAAAGRPPLATFTEIAAGEGPLASELAITVAEAGCGLPQREALESLRSRVPGGEMSAVCAAIERSQRHGSPLADQLRRQSGVLRARERRRIEERAAKAAPKIQLVVALLLVPSVLLMIAAALLVNVDRFLVGF